MGLPNAVNKKRLQIAFALLLVFAMAAAITGCGGGKDSKGGDPLFAGKWVTADGYPAPNGLPDDLELRKNGTGTCEGVEILWRAGDGRFFIMSHDSDLPDFEYDYEISETRLIITDGSGNSDIYMKEQK